MKTWIEQQDGSWIALAEDGLTISLRFGQVAQDYGAWFVYIQGQEVSRGDSLEEAKEAAESWCREHEIETSPTPSLSLD